MSNINIKKISSNYFGQFWYGNSLHFPGFLYKKNIGVGVRRSTKFNPGGNIYCNKSYGLYNKYKPGNNGIGASTTANRRVKNRVASVCNDNNSHCGQFYQYLGRYDNYTSNPNGYFPYPIYNNYIYRPLLPPNIYGEAITLTQINLLWNQPISSSILQSWDIYYSTNALGPFFSQNIVYDSNTSSYIFNDLINDTTYYIYMITNSNIGYSSPSITIQVYIPPLYYPVDIEGYAITLGEVYLFWIPNTSSIVQVVTDWFIYYSPSDSGPGSPIQVSNNSTNFVTIPNLTNNQDYSIYIVAYNSTYDIYSNPSNIITINVPPLYPPTDIEANAIGINEVYVSWVPNSSSVAQVVTDWFIYYSPSDSGPGSPIQVSNNSTNSITIPNLTNNQDYSIYIVAYNSTYDIYSNPSNTITLNLPQLPFYPTTSSDFTGFLNDDGNYIIMFINSTSNFYFLYDDISFNFILVGWGGGGGGGTQGGGGGGGGGNITQSITPLLSVSGSILNCVIGSGGTGGAISTDGHSGNITSISYNSNSYYTSFVNNYGHYRTAAVQGGDGGGSGGGNGGIDKKGKPTLANGSNGSNGGGGGGGSNGSFQGKGGNGAINNLTVYYYGTSFGAGGGGGGGNNTGGLPGNSYAGAGGNNVAGSSATPNYGGGGGGSPINAGNGGSGCVVIYFKL